VDNWLGQVEELKRVYLPEIIAAMDSVAREESPTGSSLPLMHRYQLDTGGKRLRAILPLAIARALSCDPAELVNFGAACEMLHNATLVHDDLQDGDRVRRGQASVWATFGKARAINLGDAMLYWALLLLMRIGGNPQRRERLSARLIRETLRVIDGQEREFLLQDVDDPSFDDYCRMVEGKTGGLFALTMVGSAEFCDASPAVIHGLELAAGHLSVIFQIQDDILDLYADKGRQYRGADIREGKISALAVHFFATASASKRAWLRALLRTERDEVGTDDVERVADAFVAQGSLQYALDEIARRRRLICNIPGLSETPPLQMLLIGMTEVFLKPISEIFEPAQTASAMNEAEP
jgi:geranylgeranyl diphosphate synthase type I